MKHFRPLHLQSTTVQIFTGNAIGPRGDMTSRSLMLALNVDRPDPENRAFVHPDPLAWTRTHRSTIVKALYVLLVAGALNRPQNQEAKTRFKGWWTLVGWPMEYAAGLLGINVDCTELMRAGEAGDEEASATSAALTILFEVLATEKFTAKVDGTQTDVTGMTAGSKDFNDAMRARLPYVFAFVLGLAFLLLLVTFRSIVVPLKAIVLNLLSVGAAYGILTLVFQDGHGESLLGFESLGGITAWLPLFLFVILFGLSMDYHVFILSRIREAVDRGDVAPTRRSRTASAPRRAS